MFRFSREKWLKLAKYSFYFSAILLTTVMITGIWYLNSKEYLYRTVKSFTAKVYSHTGSGSGVLIFTNKKLATVITNAHVCAKLINLPSEEEVAKMTLIDVLKLPLYESASAFVAGEEVKVSKILRLSPQDDLCLVQLDSQRLAGFGARLSTQNVNDYDDYLNPGYPGSHIMTLNRGLFVGERQSERRRLFLDPEWIKAKIEYVKNKKDTEVQMEELADKIGLLQEKLTNPKLSTKARSEMEMGYFMRVLEFKVFEMQLDALQYKAQQARVYPQDYRKDGYWNWHVYGGCSGSGIWDSQSRLIGVVWGQAPDVGQAIAIQLIDIKEFLNNPKYLL